MPRLNARLLLRALEARVTPGAGQLDSTFGSGGLVSTQILGPSDDHGRAVAIDSQGRIIVGGFTNNGTNDDFVIVRYLSTGALDSIFGGTGIVMIDLSYNERAFDLSIDSQDRVVVAGSRLTSGSNYDFAVIRLTVTGALDDSFDADGKQTIAFGAYASGVAVDSQDRIVVAGFTYNGSNNDVAVARLTVVGSLDSSFDSDGKQTIDFGGTNDFANAVAVDSLDRIVVAGYSINGSNFDTAVARLTSAGMLDSSFDADGKQSINFGTSVSEEGTDVALDSLGRIVVGGFMYQNGSNSDFAVARLTTFGILDASFDADGKQTIDFTGKLDFGYGVSVDSANRIVVAGYANGTNSDFGLARLTEAGVIDITFDIDGKTAVVFGVLDEGARDVVIDSFGRVVVAGYANTGSPVFALARLTGDTPPPKVTSITVNDSSPQRSMVTSLKVAFDSKVSFANAPSTAFQLNRQGDNAPVTLSALVDASGTFVTLTFTGGAVDLGGSLADGRYTLKIVASQFSGLGFDGDGDGLGETSPLDDYALVGNPANRLFRLFGDFDGDGSVAANDFIQFRLALGGSSVIFDFDNDGAVAASDFIDFRLRFGGSI